MAPTRTPEGVRLGGDARQRLHQARGYGEPVGESELLLAPVEAAYLLYRGDIDPVNGADFAAFCRQVGTSGFLTRLLVFKDLRERGYYLSPAPEEGTTSDFVVYERGSDPAAGRIAFEVRTVDEGSALPVQSLAPGVVAMVDAEGEVGYVDLAEYTPSGEWVLPADRGLPGEVVGSRVVVWDPPPELYAEGFFGQPIAGRNEREGTLQLSLVEALYLAEEDVLALEPTVISEHGQAHDGPTDFAARASVYRRLREAGTVPKTGFKFGATYRVYHEFAGIDAMGHSDVLVRILDRAERIEPAAIALDVRLAHGVGKRMVFALTSDSDTSTISWLSITRMTP